ncbi:hypothetical protein FOA52_005959 [Chlamydomonas sp. UWO 241]|nr:hypothetical protein FOA52_005959 [Chlamydomonas sp. UWO 241]
MQADEDEAVAYHAVLFSPDMWALKLFPWLDRASKVALRVALVRWSGMHDLTLLAVTGADDLVPLATASLAALTSLAVREALEPVAGAPVPVPALYMLALSSSVPATLQTIDVSDCGGLSSIDFVRSCGQLRCLWVPGCVSVSDLAPLAACSETLEELWMAYNYLVSLAPLKARTKLRKLDIRGHQSELRNQVKDLRLACTQLADPASVELESMVHNLQPNMPPDAQEGAAQEATNTIDEGV